MKEEYRFSSFFGKEYHLFTLCYPHYEEFQKNIIHAIDRKEDDLFKALEVGTGPGETTLFFFKKFLKAEVICVDNEKVMVDQAKENLREYKERTSFVLSDALEYLKSLENNSIDVFFSGYTLHNFNQEYRVDFLKEIFRVLKPNGVFVNGDKYALDDLKERCKAFNWSIQRFLNVYPKNERENLCYDWIIHMSEDEGKEKIMPESVSKKLMQEIGFKEISIKYREKMEAVLFARK